MRVLSIVLTSLIGLGLSTSVSALETMKVCGKYQKGESSWSPAYKLTTQFGKKSEFEALGYNLASAADPYIVLIKWKKGSPTLINIPYSIHQVTVQNGTDDRGRFWVIQKDWLFCK